MTNNSNIYDIDGNLLRKACDTSQLSVEEAEKRLNEYQEKLRQLPENEKHTASVLRTYITNLQRYIFNYYIIHPNEYKARIKSTEEQIKEAMEDLKAEVKQEDADDMDVYVEPIEEIKDETNE